jgi:tricorn protease
MHGYDWVALREQYKPLLQYVAHRSDLNYVISEMISELSVQHAYIEGGDFQIPPRPRVGLPGARFELDKQSGRYRISKIFEGENEEDLYRTGCCATRQTILFNLLSTANRRRTALAPFLTGPWRTKAI